MMFKIIECNQIIDVLDNIKFVKCLPQSKKIILVDERQANGIMSSNNNEIYHIYGTPNTFNECKHTVTYQQINIDEYNLLTQQLKDKDILEKRVEELEKLIKEIYLKIS